MKYFFLSLLILPVLVFGQSSETEKHCGTDEMHQELFLNHPEFNAGILNAALRSEQFRSQFQFSREERTGPYIIPVVFHIIHNYGPENITDAQVYDAIRVVNENYSKQNADTVDIIPAFQSIAADNEIELRLAQLDPNGNCTKGINRIQSQLTYIGDHQVKGLIQWDPSKYLNVYVVNNAAGLAGHALVPPAADTIPQWDGIVISHDYVGSIGTSSYLRSVVLSHELGHYLSLEHTWGGNNVPGYFFLPCADPGNCAFDDGVADTPNTIGWQTCNLNGASCGNVVDNVQNFMEYAYCARMFTEGQKLRMHASLNDTIANRNNLWNPVNLNATSTNGFDNLCAADFSANKYIICEGDSITLTDESYHGIVSRAWTLNGGTPNSSTDSIVTVTYNTAGVYDVSIIASDGVSPVAMTKTNYITVVSALGITAPIQEGFETTTSLPSTDWYIKNTQQDATFEITNTVASSGTNSVMIDLTNVEDGNIDELFSRTYDVSVLSNVQISFRYAFTNRDSVAQSNVVKVWISNDCGTTWTVKKQVGGANLNSAPGMSTGMYVPVASDWKTASVTNITASYLVNDFRIKFTYENVDGVALYLDDINISPNASIVEIRQEELKIYPNPGDENVMIEIPQNGEFKVCFYDLSGRILKQENGFFNAGNKIFETDFLLAGSYLIELVSADFQYSYRSIWIKNK